MDKDGKIIVVGAGVFGLSVAYQLAWEGYKHITILDRHIPPVPDGSSSDISRVIRFDYGDEEYLKIAYEAYQKWSRSPRYEGIFSPAPYILVGNAKPGQNGQAWIGKTTSALTNRQLPWTQLDDAAAAKRLHPVLTGDLASPRFVGYLNKQAGWADASKATRQLRDDCLELGVSFICGHGGTVVGFDSDSQRKIKAVRTLDGGSVQGDHFILTAGAWSSGIVPMYNSTLSTAQVVGYIRLTESEMEKYKNLPIYTNSSTGWFNFPPHGDTKMLKMAIHGWGYTRAPSKAEGARIIESNTSSPPLTPPRERPNFVPAEGEQRLRQGLREILPELGERPFEKVVLCWYTDTPTGDFIMDFHPDYKNLFIGGGGSGHAFKFLPVLGQYLSLGFKRQLPPHLAAKWRFRTEYQNREDAFVGDGSRGGPAKRELDVQERAKL